MPLRQFRCVARRPAQREDLPACAQAPTKGLSALRQLSCQPQSLLLGMTATPPAGMMFDENCACSSKGVPVPL
jgi:hypothetical protein